MSFTAEQKIVANLDKGVHLVLAPPGTGKTDILSERIKIALEKGIEQKKMLCLTFTNRAAKEMNQRILEKFGKSDIFIGNVHTFCLHFLKEKFVLNNASILLDEDEASNILQEAIQKYVSNQIALNHGKIVDQRKYEYELNKSIKDIKPYLLSQIISYINYTVKYNIPKELTYLNLPTLPTHILEKVVPTFENSYSDIMKQRLLDIADIYNEIKKSVNGVDFDDLLAITYNYLIDNPQSDNLYEWLQIDEVQDLNPMQWKIIEMISSSSAHKVFFGDYEQAIYSFLGAKLANLQSLEEVAELHSFSQNFRSPPYILNLLVKYAKALLSPKWKKEPFSFSEDKPDQISLCFRQIDGFEENEYLFIVKKIIPNLPSEELKAVLVRTNAQADKVADYLQADRLEIFKISGTDVFKYAVIKTALAIMSVMADKYSRASWIRIFYELTNLSKLQEARDFIVQSFDLGFIPKDFITGEITLLEDFHYSLQNNRIVVFDTETTGLDTENDDIIQIAAIEIVNGKLGRTFEVYMDTDKDLTESEKVHHISRDFLSKNGTSLQEGLRQFLDFAGDDILVAHNLTYDYKICKSNFKRFNIDFNKKTKFFDTLDIGKRLFPNLPIYKLSYLIDILKVEGVNSHNALDDVKATANLIFKMFESPENLFNARADFLSKKHSVITSARQNLDFIYSELQKFLYTFSDLSFLFKKVLESCYQRKKFTVAHEAYKISNHMDHFLKPGNLLKLLEENINDYNTFKEADLYTEKEKIVVSTIHKAKGLQFTNVIMPNCYEGNFPFYYSEDHSEDARLFYVGLSRSRKRLILTSSHLNSRRSKVENNELVYEPLRLSPFIDPIYPLLDYKFINLKKK